MLALSWDYDDMSAEMLVVQKVKGLLVVVGSSASIDEVGIFVKYDIAEPLTAVFRHKGNEFRILKCSLHFAAPSK